MRSGSGFRPAAALTGVAALLAALQGCGAVWTYDEAMDLRRATYAFHFDPPDSVAYALPYPPPVYAAIFDESMYVPPDPVVLPLSRSPRARSGPDAAGPDTLGTVPPLITLEPPPPVQVDLSPAQESELRGRARRTMVEADSLLARYIRSAGRGAEQSEQLRAARGLLNQASSALERRDYQGAANLADKAHILAERLIASRP